MTIIDLFDYLMEDNIDLHLMGEISCDDEEINWIYDGLGNTNGGMETHLIDVYEEDREILNNFIFEKKQEGYFFIHEPEINESFITFKISED